jgi:hypothetical protein
VIKSQSDAIQLWGGHMNNLSFKDVKLIGGGKGFKAYKKKQKSYAIATQGKGNALFSNLTFKKYCIKKKNKNKDFQLNFIKE